LPTIIDPRYALTTVEAYMRNKLDYAREVTFSVALPDTAFVSNFSMNLNLKEELVSIL
jgi:hypothetical protein